jgi:hypothetical protein
VYGFELNQPAKQFMYPLKALFTGAVLIAATAIGAESPALTKLQGKWSGKRTSSSGQEVSQRIEIKDDKLTFQIIDAGNEVRFFAKGEVRAETLGPFSVLKITNLEAGRSPDQLQPVSDELNTIFVLRGDTLILASNFDKERDNQKPRLDQYERGEGVKESAAASKLAGKWNVIVKASEGDRDYELNLTEADGKLSGALISPRSGEHKFKSVTYTDGKLMMEWPREFDGNQVTFLYTGELKGNELAGDFVVKGFEDQYKGTWKATK